MKKILCLALVCLMAFSGMALAYDGSAPVVEENKTISILTTNSGSKTGGFEDMIWWQEVLNRANITLDMEYIDDSSYKDAVMPRLAAAVDLADIVRLPGADSDMSYANSGIFLDLAGYYDTLGFNIQKQFELYPTLKASLTTPDGGMYYVPTLTPADCNMRTLMINRLYCEALGMKVEDITDIESYTEYLRAVKANDCNGNGDPDDEIPMFMRSGMIGLARMYFGLDGEGWYQNENGTIICTATDDRYKEFLEWCNVLYTEGLLYNEYTTANYDTQTALFASNQTGSIIHFISNCTDYSGAIDTSWQFNVDEPYMVPVALKGTDGSEVCWGRNVYTGGGFGITSTASDPETAFAFLDYLANDEVGVLTWYGIEGVDYEMVDGDYAFTDVYYNNADDYLTKCGYNCMALPNFFQYYDSKQCNQVRTAISTLSECVKNPSIGYTYYQDAENEIINAYASDLSTYFDENQTAFIMGTRSFDEWDAYVETVKSMQVDELIAVYQAAADRAN